MGRTKSVKIFSRISLHLPLVHIKVLRNISQEEDLTVSQIIRRAVELYLATQKHFIDFNYNDLELDTHLSETRTKRAIFLSHADGIDKQKNNNSNIQGEVFDDIFEELNPDAF
jgi:hypothetical protein